jgi:hypothetical protein
MIFLQSLLTDTPCAAAAEFSWSSMYSGRQMLTVTAHFLSEHSLNLIPFLTIACLIRDGVLLQRSQLLTALSVGTEIFQLHRIALSLGLGSDLDDGKARGRCRHGSWHGCHEVRRVRLLDRHRSARA